jgi:hypothetical protein
MWYTGWFSGRFYQTLEGHHQKRGEMPSKIPVNWMPGHIFLSYYALNTRSCEL